MGYEKILVPYDNSEHAKRALAAAVEMVDYMLAREIVVLFVTEAYRGADPMLESAARISGVQVTTFTKMEHEELDADIADQIKGFEHIVTTVVRIGQPKDEILETAAEHSSNLIIMGSRGLGPIRSMLGSVSYAVLRDSEIPVLIMK